MNLCILPLIPNGIITKHNVINMYVMISDEKSIRKFKIMRIFKLKLVYDICITNLL